jgi:DNA repair exonuclease SbcCD nuclease subunit
MASQVAGIFLSDCHWSETPPVARSVEPDWFGVQAGYCEQVYNLHRKYNAPVFIAGDLFDRWDSRAHLISQVISWIKPFKPFCIPGNHDTPNHNKLLLPKSAYWTLVEAEAITHLIPGGTHTIGSLIVHPFPYGHTLTPPNLKAPSVCLNVALVHAFIHTKRTGHAGCTEETRYASWMKRLKGYDVAVFGDNHKPFLIQEDKKCAVLNCGGFMRLHSDQQEHKPSVGLLYSNGEMKRHFLNVEGDRFLDAGKEIKLLEDSLEIDLSELTEELRNLQTERLDFAKIVLRWMESHSIPPEIKTVILRAIGARRR